MPPSATTLRDSAGVRLGRSLSRIRRRSGLHHTRNAHAHCPSEPPGSSIPIGRKPSQPPRPSGLPHCFTYTASQPRERERERELSPLRRRPSLSSPLHVCLYTRIHSPSFLICPCVYKRARAFPFLHMHLFALSVHTPALPTYPSFLCDRPLSYSVPFPARGTGRVSPTWRASDVDSGYPSRKQRKKERKRRVISEGSEPRIYLRIPLSREHAAPITRSDSSR